MLKLAGSIMIVAASFFLFGSKMFTAYFTYKFYETVTEVVQKIKYETQINIPYYKVFEKIGFDREQFVKGINGYVDKTETEKVCEFLDNLGTHNSVSEQQYINYSMENFLERKQLYYKLYSDNKKVYGICGISVGLIIVIMFV